VRRVRPRLPGGLRPWLAVVGVCALALPLALAAVYGTGYPPARLTLAAGTAWLPSPAQGLVTLVDGPSELVVGSVRAPVRGDGDVVQVGSSALLVDPGSGTVRRLNGATYEVSDPLQFAAGGALTVLAGRSTAYVLDTARHTASALDPTTMRASAEIPLGAAPGLDQAVVDDDNKLWAVDGTAGGLAGFTAEGGGRSPVRSSAVDKAARLTLVQGRPAVVDAARGEAGLVGTDAQVARWTCFPTTDAPGTQLLGSTTSPRLYAAVPTTGSLEVADLGGGACPATVAVGHPGDRFGPLVEANGYVLVPNETTGKVVAVDVSAGAVREELSVLPTTPSRLELVAKDGLVFYNDLAGERAGVIRFDGQWTVGPAGEKFRVRDGQPETVLTSGAGDIPPGAAPAPPPRRGGAGTGSGRPAGPPVVGGPPAAPAPVPPAMVRVPDFSSVLHQEYANAITYIRNQITGACGGGQLCLTPVPSAGTPPPDVPIAAPPQPCVITAVPGAGGLVARGSTLTFMVDRPCGETTTTTSATATTSASASTSASTSASASASRSAEPPGSSSVTPPSPVENPPRARVQNPEPPASLVKKEPPPAAGKASQPASKPPVKSKAPPVDEPASPAAPAS
jgi:hypothetical protein